MVTRALDAHYAVFNIRRSIVHVLHLKTKLWCTSSRILGCILSCGARNQLIIDIEDIKLPLNLPNVHDDLLIG